MFKALFRPIIELFDADILPVLDEDEKKCIEHKHVSILNEGIRLVPGGRFGNGRIVMTKTVDAVDFNEFFYDLITAISFPGLLSVDAHGFVESKDGEPVFIFGSKNSSILLWDDDQSVYLERFEIVDMFKIVDINKFLVTNRSTKLTTSSRK